MKSAFFRFLAGVVALGCLASIAAAPTVSNIRAAQRPGTKLVDIHYDLAYTEGSTVTVTIQVSADGGATYNSVPAVTFTGAIGSGITPGADKHVVWDAGTDWDGLFTPRGRVRVTAAEDGSVRAGMAFIPAVEFLMGEPNAPRSVYVSQFWLDRYEVTYELWTRVHDWAVPRDYAFSGGLRTGAGVAPDHPVHSISWYDAVKWCNARSEMEGLTPIYYADNAQIQVYRTGELDVPNARVTWSANGYRLPTEAEWEKAARGGLIGLDYPWGVGIDGSKANYSDSQHPFRPNRPPTTPVGYYDGNQTPPGLDMANGYGLYDMAGNVWEWCWDWSASLPSAPQTDPIGPNTGSSRVLRGGSWDTNTGYLRCANRSNSSPSSTYNYTPSFSVNNIGFRCARGF